MTQGERRGPGAIRDLQGFGERVRRVREDAGVTQEHLAARCGVRRGHITRIEGGLVNVPLETVFRLAFALDLEAWQLLYPGDVRPGVGICVMS